MSAGAAAVLESLHAAAGAACSGEALSAARGVSRAQIWKHVEALRKLGYEVEGAPGGGYRLGGVPDRLYPEEIGRGLETRWLARSIHYFESVDSTNRVALDLGREGAAHGTAVVAEHQSAGRGRLGRSFFSPPYANLYTTLLLRPDLDLAAAPTLIPSAAVAVAETVEQTLRSQRPDTSACVEIKWPNDVLIDGRKTCGILMELVAEATQVGFAVLGIGVNLNVERAELPEDFRARATSLSTQLGVRIDRAAFARRLYGMLERVLDDHATGGFEAIRPRFEALFRMRGRQVEVTGLHGESLAGRALGIATDGALEVETASGVVERVLAGDVTLSSSGAQSGKEAGEEPRESPGVGQTAPEEDSP